MRLLVVEDDVKLAAAVGRGLRHAGYAVDVVGDGEPALRHAAVWDYDGIVLDVMLRGATAWRSARCCASAAAGLPCWCSRRAARSPTGSAGWTPAPTTTSPSRSTSASCSRGCGRSPAAAPAERPAVIEAGDLRIDPASREVTRAGSPVALTAREYAVLEFLARNAGDVVTRAHLLDHVWDANYEGSTNIVDQYVGALRRKLGRPPLIHTVRGAGFRLGP